LAAVELLVLPVLVVHQVGKVEILVLIQAHQLAVAVELDLV
jgi:hypothetical protein